MVVCVNRRRRGRFGRPSRSMSWRSASTATGRRWSRSMSAAKRHGRRSPSSTRARPPKQPSCRRDRPPRLGARPAAGRAVAGAPRTRRRRADPLVPHYLGMARLPVDGGRHRTACPRASASRPDSSRGDGPPARPPAGVHGDGRHRRPAHRRSSRGVRSAPGIPVAGGTNDAFASYPRRRDDQAGRCLSIGGSAGGFGVYWHEPVAVPGAFVTPAPLAGLYSVGAAMAATGRALDWFRDAVVGGGVTTERLLEEAGTTPAGADGVVFLPYLAGERSPIWDPDATRRVRRAHARARSRPSGARDPRGERAGDPPRRGADACRRSDGQRDASVRRPGSQRDAGTRSRPTSLASPSWSPPCSRRPCSARRCSGPSASGRLPTWPPPSGR